MYRRIKSWLLENRNAKQTVAKNTIWLSVGTMAGRIIKAVIIIYAARVLGAEKYGIFSYALSLAAIFSIFSDAGTTSVLTREISKNPESIGKYLSTSLYIKLGLTLISVVLTIIVAPAISTVRGASALLPLAAMLIIFDGLRDFSFSLTRALEKMELEAGITIITGVAITALGFGVLFIHPGPFSLMFGYVMGSGVGLLASIIILRKYIAEFFGKFDKDLAISIFKESIPFALSGLLAALTINTDTIMIGWLQNATAVGLYSAVQRPILLIYILPGLVATSAFPLLSKLVHRENSRVRSIMERTVMALLLFAIPVVMGGIVLAPQIVNLIFGPEYIQATPTFMVLLLTIILVFPAGIITNSIFAYGKQKSLVWFFLVGGISNVVLDYLLIPRFGILGSAIATLISQTLCYGLAWREMKKINNFYTIKYLWRGLLASGCMAVIALCLTNLGINVILNIILSGLAYAAFLYLLKEKHFLEIISPLMRRLRLANLEG